LHIRIGSEEIYFAGYLSNGALMGKFSRQSTTTRGLIIVSGLLLCQQLLDSLRDKRLVNAFE
jgi:hypothetical protein